MGYRLVAASGAAVDALISSDVGKYLEFKAIETVYFATSSLPSSAAKSSGSGSGIKIEKVPSTKAGIFSTSLLSPLEKRSLMKFLQVRACTCTCACACACECACVGVCMCILVSSQFLRLRTYRSSPPSLSQCNCHCRYLFTPSHPPTHSTLLHCTSLDS